MPAYSGAELRIRDKAIEDRYRKEIAAAESKYQRLSRAYDDLSNQLHACRNLGEKVADGLGFHSLAEVKIFMDIADEPLPYKGLAGRIEALKAELAVERRGNGDLRDEIAYLQEERDLLKATLAQNERRVAQIPVFKQSFAKWKAFKLWMQEKEEEFKAKTKGMRTAEKMRHREALFLKERRKLKEMGLESDDDLQGALGLPETPVPMTKPRTSIPPTFASSPTVVPSSSTTPATREGGPKLPITPAPSSTRTPLQFESVRISRPSLADQSSPIPPVVASKLSEVIDLSNEVIDSSQTEDDSQGQSSLQRRTLKLTMLSGSVTFVSKLTTKPAQAPENSQENDITFSSQSSTSKTTQKPLLPAPHPTLPARPNFPQFGRGEKSKKQRHSDAFPAASMRRDSDITDQERPRKMRRFSSPVRAPLTAIPTTGVRSSMGGASASSSRGRENRAGPRANSKGGENAPASTPANTSASKQLTDYSAFKGRGRYGKAPASGNDTINAAFAIDPAQNGGLDFQYDAVYYEAIGPLPSRLQPPLWRSPPNSPEKARLKAISRHRHNWARASTPPSYWHIGFPTTQEAENINEKAARMHSQKRRDVEAEAESGGRYYKTK
ncbi:hypothetical protein FB451DRAFT_1407141 [Mycena latifolia]|nr:hypothetical protein FB451DRAFT_1407141 [Mycena latifolia]